MRRIPLEYGDNFPVTQRSWNPTVPWRFPKYQVRSSSLLNQLLPWVMLGLGVTLGVLWMYLKAVPPSGAEDDLKELSVEKTGAVVVPRGPSTQPEGGPRHRPRKFRSELA